MLGTLAFDFSPSLAMVACVWKMFNPEQPSASVMVLRGHLTS
jgi:hypothetical protein